MEFELHSHRYAQSILENEAEFKDEWNQIRNILSRISEQMIIDSFTNNYSGINKSLSRTINALLREEFKKEGWYQESSIFKRPGYTDSVWRLDFAKNNISIEVAFNHSESIAWNLLKPVLASELNHVEKAIQTKLGIIICATNELKVAGNFDSAIGTFEKFIHYLKPLNNQLTTPLLIIGLKAPNSFKLEPYHNGLRKTGRIVQFSEEAITADLLNTESI